MPILKKFITVYAMAFAACCQSMAGIAVLDMTLRNKENETSGDWSRCLYSATYLCDIAGYDYIVTESLDEAMGHELILFSNCVTANSFTPDEWEAIDSWVADDGGVIVSPAFRSVADDSKDFVSALFGIDVDKSGVKSSGRRFIIWNPEYFDDPDLEYIDEDYERTTSLGTAKSYLLVPTDAEILAHFDGDDVAVTRNMRGKGKAYIIPVAWRDVVQRNQLNKDLNSSRVYSNGFEPSSDVWALLLRSVYASNAGVSVWKFTVPGGYTQVLVPTHDCDSKTAYDEMHFMADYEKSLGFNGHYFLTVHYFSDKVNFGHSYLSDFYNETTIPKVEELLDAGHTVGSHSICHFPDFNKTLNTDVVTKDEYAHRATCLDGVSTGVSTWAEIVLSKQILEEDLGNKVRSFRSGHLCVNPDFHTMLKEGEYEFQSCYAAGDLLLQFPFFGRFDNTWEGQQSSVLTIPLHISDVYDSNDVGGPLNNDTWETHIAPDMWYDTMQKLRGNYASAILLIHPNREWKMTLQKKLVDQLDRSEVGFYNFEDYGDFWISRLNADYTYDYDNASGLLTIITDTDNLSKSKMTFAAEVFNGDIIGAVIKNADGSVNLEADIRQISCHRYLIIPKIYNFGDDNKVWEVLQNDCVSNGIYDLGGRALYNGGDIESALTTLPKGVYVVKDGNKTRKLII